MNHLIEAQSQLTELEPLFRQLSVQKSAVAVDTEFLREKTYNAKLCLVQLGIGEHQYCIDVLAIDDLSVLVDLFSDQNVLKIFHAARQDMEVIFQTFGILPQPIFDTQLAAAFCGSDMQIGYGAMVEKHTGIELPKTQSRTDWKRRPLSKDQLAYAADDVAHLEALYLAVLAQLKSSNKLEWYSAEIDSYYDTDKYVVDPAQAYKRLSAGSLKLCQQYTLKSLAEWREIMAQERDIPRSWVIRDDKLFSLAERQPKTEKEVKEMAVFGRKSASYLARKAAAIISSVEVGQEIIWRRVEPLTKQEKNICNALMKEIAKLAKEHQIAQALLGTRKELETLYRHRQSDKMLTGWRENLVGKPLLEYLRSEGV